MSDSLSYRGNLKNKTKPQQCNPVLNWYLCRPSAMWKFALKVEKNSLALLHTVQHCKRVMNAPSASQTLAASRCDSFPDGLHSHFSPAPLLFLTLLPAGWFQACARASSLPADRAPLQPNSFPLPWRSCLSPVPLCLPTSPTHFLSHHTSRQEQESWQEQGSWQEIPARIAGSRERTRRTGSLLSLGALRLGMERGSRELERQVWLCSLGL